MASKTKINVNEETKRDVHFDSGQGVDIRVYVENDTPKSIEVRHYENEGQTVSKATFPGDLGRVAALKELCEAVEAHFGK